MSDDRVPCARCTQPTMYFCTLCLEPICNECVIGYLCDECENGDD